MNSLSVSILIILVISVICGGCVVVQVPSGSQTPSSQVNPDTTPTAIPQENTLIPTTPVPIITTNGPEQSTATSSGTPETAQAPPTTTTVTVAEPTTTTLDTTTETTVTPGISYLTKDEINRHFMNTVFGTKSATITKWTNDVLTCSVQNLYQKDDFTNLESFIKEFDKQTQSARISEMVKKDTKGRLVFSYIPKKNLDAIDDEEIQDVIRDPETDEIQVKIGYKTDANDITAYINADLTGDKRAHYTIRAALYMLGFVGFTVDYPDSVFNVYSDTNSRLSIIDKEAIKIMYGNTIKNGMSQDTVRRVLMMT